MWDLRMMGGELGIMGLVGLVTTDTRVRRLGKEAGINNFPFSATFL